MKNSLTQSLGVLFILILLGSQTGYGQSKKAPDWVWSTPVSNDTYYGVGIAKLESENYRLTARKMALREIVEKIFVSIHSKSALLLDYSEEEIEYQLNEQINLASSSLLIGHEKMDDWIDKKTDSYYVLFRLDKNIYEQERDLYFEEVIKKIEIIQGDAKFLSNSGELTSAIVKTTKSLSILKNELKIVLEPKYENTLKLKKHGLIIDLENQLRRVQFRHNSTYEFDVSNPEPLTISQLAYDKSSNNVLHKLPLKLTSLHGDVFWYEFTDYIDGDQLKIYGVFPENKFAKFRMEIDFPIPVDIKKEIDPTIWEGLKSNTITLTFKPYPIKVVAKSSNAKSTDDTYLKDYLTYIFQDLGIYQTDAGEDFLLRMEINSSSNVRKSYKQFNTSISGDITIKDKDFNKSMFSYKFLPGYGTAGSLAHANQKAMRLLIDKNAPMFLEGYLKFLCSKHASLRSAKVAID